MNPATRHNARLSRREESRGAHFYLFRPVTHVAHSNLHAPTRLPEPAASRIVESFKIFMRHDPLPLPPLVVSSSIVALEEGTWLFGDESVNVEEPRIRRGREIYHSNRRSKIEDYT